MSDFNITEYNKKIKDCVDEILEKIEPLIEKDSTLVTNALIDIAVSLRTQIMIAHAGAENALKFIQLLVAKKHLEEQEENTKVH